MHWVVMLAGGSGTRFWPLSSPRRPKHLLPLAGEASTATTTVATVLPLVPRERMLAVTGAALGDALGATVDLPPENLLLEPRAASTAPALVWAAHEAARRDPDAVLLCLHADWHLPDGEAFREAATMVLEAARREDALVTVGIRPTRPDPGYGYILAAATGSQGVRKVERFIEKPDADRARDLIAQGALWNSGLFAWSAARLLAEIDQWTPEIAEALPRLAAGDVAGFYAGVTPISIDHGLLERSERVVTVTGDFAWDDIGTFEALSRVRPADARGNVAVGPVSLVDSSGCVVWTEGTPVVASGVEDLVIVAANGRILVMHRDRASDLKTTLDAVPREVLELP